MLLCVGLALFSTSASALDAPERALVRSLVEATHLNEAAIDDEVERLVSEIDGIVARFDHGPPTYKRARRLHDLLHRQVLTTYDRDADTLSGVFDDGSFNCLSASLLYGTIARSLGFSTRALSEPGHIRIRLEIGRRWVDVETTLPTGFDASETRRHAEPGKTAASSAADPDSLSLPLEAAVGFAWLNRAWRDLDRGASVRAAHDVERGLRRLPAEAGQIDLARLLLARAFGVEYDAGRFQGAFEIAAIDAGLFPERTTARDRLVAAAIKRVESACDDDRPSRALAVVDAARRSIDGSAEFERLVRRTYPGIAAAAVRRADWALARKISGGYASVQPDRREVERLERWIESRRNPRRAVTQAAPPVLIY